MDILASGERVKLIEFMQTIRFEITQWVIAEIRVIPHVDDKNKHSVREIAYALKKYFDFYDGKILVCNQTEFLMVIRWKDATHLKLANEIKAQMPEGRCHVEVLPPNKEGLRRLELSFDTAKGRQNDNLLMRQLREENVIMIADDDMLMRKIIHKIADDNNFRTIEVTTGSVVKTEYFKHLPDVLFLDIHFPDAMGTDLLQEILVVDPDAYVVMLSADSTPENVIATRKMGAAGFLTKPVKRQLVLGYISKCDTIRMSGE